MQNLSTSFSSFYSGQFIPILRQGFHFFIQIYRTGKTVELFSFVLWEFLYKMRYYRSSRTIKLTSSRPFTIDADGCLYSPEYEGDCETKQMNIEPNAIDWKYCFQGNNQLVWGCEYQRDTILIKAREQTIIQQVWSFSASIRSLYVTDKAIFVCAGGVLYRSSIDLYQFNEVVKLTTPQSYFLFNNGFCELPDGTLLFGEYASIWQNNRWVSLAYLYLSNDGGHTWNVADFLKRQGVNKHIHLVKFSPQLNQLFLTDGDNKKQLWRNTTLNNYAGMAGKKPHGWQLVNRFHWQMGGYTSMLSHENGVVFGTDYLGGTNFLVHTADGTNFHKEVIPNPYRRSPIINMVSRKIGNRTELWALLHNSVVPGRSCLVMYSNDNGASWNRFIEYDGRQHEIQLVSSSAGMVDELYFCVRQWNSGTEVSKTYRVKG